jgi:hypothetical protein
MSTPQPTTSAPAAPVLPHRRTILALAVVTALGAAVGAVGLVAGDGMGLDPAVLARTPFTSWLLPGIALALLVGAPTTATAVAAARRSPRTPALAVGTGVVLAGWLALQPAWLNLVHPFTVVFGGVAVALTVLGARAGRPGARLAPGRPSAGHRDVTGTDRCS